MTAESLGHIFMFIGIVSTWIFPLWLYFHQLRGHAKMLADYILVMVYSAVYFIFIAHYFKFTVSVTI